jgi:hypothetical protein
MKKGRSNPGGTENTDLYGPEANRPFDQWRWRRWLHALALEGTNGSISLWKLDGNLNEVAFHVYGSYPDYDPIAITAAANSYTYVLWRNTDNSISLWGVDPALNFAFYKSYGPYPGFIAETLSTDTNGNSTLRLIWRNTNGQADVWFLDAALNYIRSKVYVNSLGITQGRQSWLMLAKRCNEIPRGFCGEDDRMLLDSILTDFLQGMRDRALIGVMLFPLREFRLSLGSQLTSSNGF